MTASAHLQTDGVHAVAISINAYEQGLEVAEDFGRRQERIGLAAGIVLNMACRHCQQNGGVVGIDDRDFAAIEAYGLEQWLPDR